MRAMTRSYSSALPLLVLGVLANHPYHPAAADDLALGADPLDRCAHLHDPVPFAPDKSAQPVDDPAGGEVVGGQLDEHLVAGQDADEVLAHLARDVGEHLVLVLELHPEHGVREVLDHGRLDLDRLFLLRQARVPICHTDQTAMPSGCAGKPSTRGPRSVTATEYSKWADSEPSAVRAVQPSASMRTSWPPALTIGSIARTIPGRSRIPLPGSPKLGTWGSSCREVPMPWPTNSRTTEKPFFSTCRCTALPMSCRRFFGRTCSTERSSASSVTASSRSACGLTLPQPKVRAASP